MHVQILSSAQFDKEISKYVGQPETDRLKQYVFIPVNLNTATDEDCQPGFPQPSAQAGQCAEHREGPDAGETGAWSFGMPGPLTLDATALPRPPVETLPRATRN